MSIPENSPVEFRELLSDLNQAIEKEFPTSWRGRIVSLCTLSKSTKIIEIFEKFSATTTTLLQNLEENQNETNREEVRSKIYDIQIELGTTLNRVLEITPKLRTNNSSSSLQQFNTALRPLENLYQHNLGIDELEKIAFDYDPPSQHEALNRWQHRHSSVLSPESLATYPKEKVLHLTSLMRRASVTNATSLLPPYAKEYLAILSSNSSSAEKARRIQTLFSDTPELGHAAVAHLVNISHFNIKELFENHFPTAQKLQKEINNLAPYLRYLDCSSCPLRSLSMEFPNLLELTCSNCNFLSSISSELPNLQILECCKCPLLNSISFEIPNLKELHCSNCPVLSALPIELPNLQTLSCYLCHSLNSISSELSNLKTLNCRSCHSLNSISSELPNLKLLESATCPLLSSLPTELPTLDTLDCHNCYSLSFLPAVLPNLRSLNCTHCPIEVLPQVPLTATVHHNAQENSNSPSRIEVDVDTLRNNPKIYLIQLGDDFLLQNKPFPSLHYANSPGIDAGGLKRDFLTRLFQGLYHPSNSNHLPSVEGGQGVWPVANGSEEILSCYRTIGRLFYLCYRNVASLKIGEVFTPKLFDILKIAGFAEETEEGLLSAFLLEKNLAPAIAKLASQEPLPSNFPANFYEIAASCMEPVPADPEEYFQLASNRQLFREHLLGLAQENPFLQATLIIAKELKSVMKPDEWTAFCSETTHTLMSKIQGELSKDLLKTSLSWHDRQYPTNSSKLQKTKALLEKWIEKASEEKLRAFLQATIGNCTLGPQDRVLINVYAGRGSSYIPTSHTCSFELELSADYVDFTVFEQSLKIYLEHALTGSGFQFG